MRRSRNVVRHTRPDGSVKTYVYEGKRPGHHPPERTVGWLIKKYEESPEFERLKPASQKLYKHSLKLFDVIRYHPVADVKPKHIRAIRDQVKKKPGIANAFVAAAGALFAWALDQEIRDDFNPANKVKRLKLQERGPWPEAALVDAEQKLSGGIKTAFMLGLYTGQRRGDILAMRWSSYDGQFITLTQQKTAEPLAIPVAPALKAHLDSLTKQGPLIVVRENGHPWTEKGFETMFRRAVAKLGYGRLLFHGLRHTAATRMAEAGCSVFQIAAVTGHKDLNTVRRYTKRAEQKKLAQAALAQVYDFASVQNTSKKANEYN